MVPYNMVNLASSLVIKRKFNFNRLVSGLSLFAVSVALFIISMTAMKYIERFQEKFIFLMQEHLRHVVAQKANLFILKKMKISVIKYQEINSRS